MIMKTAGNTDQSIDIFIQDSSSTTGAGLTGLAYNTSGLTCYYRRGATGTSTQLTLATQTAGGAHSDGGFVAVDGTNMPGVYRLDLSDAIVASGVNEVTIYLRGASNMAPCTARITLLAATNDVNVVSMAANTVTASALASDAVTEIQSGLATAAALDVVDNFLDTEIAAIISTLGTPAGASISADIAAIEAQTDDIGAAGAGLTNVPWNAAWDAEVQSEVQDAIEANHLDHLLATTYDPASKPGAADALLNELVENDGGVSRFTANALEQAPSGTGASASAIADAVWDEARADHVAAGSFGEGVASVQGNVTGSVGSVTTVNDKTGYRLSATGVDDVWDESQSGHTTAGTFGRFLDAQVANVEADTQDIQGRIPAALVSGRMDSSVGAMAANVMTAAAAAADLTTELQSGLATASALATAQADLDILTGADGAIIASGTQTFNITGNLSGSVGSVTGAVGSVAGNVGGNVAGSVGSLSAAAVDSILDEALTELAAVPAAAPSLRAAIQFLYMALRNRSTTTASAQTIQDDAGATIGTASLSDDGTTYTKGEFA